MLKSPPAIFTLLLVGIIFLTACIPEPGTTPVADKMPDMPATNEPETAVPPTNPPTPLPTSRPAITLPISIYIMDSEDDSLNSHRNTDEIAAIYENVNDIWAQAGIVVEVQTIQRLTLPDDVAQSIVRGDFRPFFAGIGYDFAIPESSLLNGFYAGGIGGPNGIVPFSADIFFVADEPSVHDERVTSHEIGHILGLHHTLDDPDRLMFSGTNGMTLTEEEIIVARYATQGLLDRVR